MKELYKIYIFVKRSLLHDASYRVSMILTVLNVLVGVVSYFYLARLVAAGHNDLLAEFHDNAAAFIVVGTTFNSFVGTALASYSGSLESEQWLGTLEYWLLARTPIFRLVVYSTVWEFLWPAFYTTLTFLFLRFIFGVQFNVAWSTTFVFVVLTILSMSGLGLMSAGIIMITKHGDPVAYTWNVLTSLLSGVFYPISVLPDWLQVASALLPTTHALRGLRAALIDHASLLQEKNELFILLGFSFLTIPLGIWLFRYGFERSRREGSLAQF